MKKLSQVLPAMLLPAIMLPATLVTGSLALSTTAFADWKPNCTGGATLKSKVGSPASYRCETSRNAVCPDGLAPRVNQTNHDTCNAASPPRNYTQCKLRAGDRRQNWVITIDAQGRTDQCRHRSVSKPPRQVKCPSGYTQNSRQGRDNCTRTSSQQVPVQCPAGTIKKKAGKDKCITERAPGWRNV